MEPPLYHGGFTDVWRSQYRGREVAVKAVRVHLNDDVEKIRKAGYPQLVAFINELTAVRTEVLQGGRSVEDSSSSERVASVRRDDDRGSVRDGVRVDGEWEHKRVCGGASQRGSAGACRFLVQGPYLHLSLTVA